MELTGKVALVTGAASGIGLASARALAARGAAVVLVDVADEAGQRAAQELGGLYVHTDVSDPDAWDDLIAAVVNAHGRLDVAHLNAGVSMPAPDITTMGVEHYRRVTGVNLDGVFFGIRATVPVIERSGGGAVMVTASMAALMALTVDPVYALTKHAVVGLVRSVAEDLGRRGITINAVCPGMVNTGMLRSSVKASIPELGIPVMEPEVVIDAVLSLLDSGVTGQAVMVRPGRPPEPYRFPNVGGSRLGEARGPNGEALW